MGRQSVMLCTICLNEMEFLPALYAQHRCWPDMRRWVFVEGADVSYAVSNPDQVTGSGLSVDGTTEFLQRLATKDSRITYIPHGFARHEDPAQAKCILRQRYLEVAEEVQPDYLFIVDADEFYIRYHQQHINWTMCNRPQFNAFVFNHYHLWRPPSMFSAPRFALEIKGEPFWNMNFCRGWKWCKGMKYIDHHGHPHDKDGRPLWRKGNVYRARNSDVHCLHLGFTATRNSREAKHRYYFERGEGSNDGRRKHNAGRRLFETWKPGDRLPRHTKVISYQGPIPEVYADGSFA